MTIKLPEKTHTLGGSLPPIPQKVVSWPWGGTPNLMAWSLSKLKYPLGTIIYEVVDGHPVLAQIQTHYGYGAHPEWPDKAHKGTSVYVPVATDPQTGRSAPLRDAPEGWGDDSTMGFDWWLPVAFGIGGIGGFLTGGASGVMVGAIKAQQLSDEWLTKHDYTDVRNQMNAELWKLGPPHATNPASQIAGEMYAKRRGGGYRFSADSFGHDGSRFNPDVYDSFCVRRHGMMY
jgi:hypothetical protein